ncbi:SRPBCC family protein [Spirulina sp. 06S082]|uniref:SRPBCC family protein n=1 Tax=Spirulina sp. 06S082 TaxID=3110248 RepID=UPI002B1F2F81|nr:SRPBCC family protein [Spirulina sp. 06S082]MEA5468080.1 SRPBCC family protein [Spirulina sp. 06S082]
MLNFKYSTLIDASVETVWNFHERADILQVLTPPWQPVKVIRREGGLGVGAISEFRLFIGFIPVTWVARHTHFKLYCFFIDEQIEGPLVSWQHRHQFDDEGGQTRLTDAIAYELPGGGLAEFFLGWWVELRLRDMFRYRHEVTQQKCENAYHSIDDLSS